MKKLYGVYDGAKRIKEFTDYDEAVRFILNNNPNFWIAENSIIMGQSSREFLEQREKQSLYGISADYAMILDRIMEEDGEVTEELSEALAINKEELQIKSTGYVAIINKLSAESDYIDLEVKRLQALNKVRQNATTRLKTALSDAMHLYELDEIKTPLNKINFRKSESVVIECEPEELPKHLQKIKIEAISKTEIKAMIKAGEEFEGVKLVTNKNLQIK